MPVWHVSTSIQEPGVRMLVTPERCERTAVELLAGVGGDVEWWYWNSYRRIGHLRVAVTADEYSLCPAGMVVDDAGEAGPPRRRTVVMR